MADKPPRYFVYQSYSSPHPPPDDLPEDTNRGKWVYDPIYAKRSENDITFGELARRARAGQCVNCQRSVVNEQGVQVDLLIMGYCLQCWRASHHG
jgi:hypothetical protein